MTGSVSSEESPSAWAVRRAEELIASLAGVLSTRIVADRQGSIEEIHVLTTAEVQPKQTVRNVESALMAQLGLKVDHRKISVAQTAEMKPLVALEREAVAEQASRRLVVFQDLVIESPRPMRVQVKVLLKHGGTELEGLEEGVDEARSRVQLAARAAVKALERDLVEAGVVLEGVRVVDAFDRKIVLAAVHGIGGRSSQLLVGTCEVRESPEQAAVLAVLDATNRWYLQQH
ncbi:MAG: hypothetical protein A2083_10135 [Gemmatimonadetes bacterium GWC2_71_9]|nr:MAG: hypothetical protein A2083_10135 [Gemmatimonadetes bacterium GWC2_71_9]